MLRVLPPTASTLGDTEGHSGPYQAPASPEASPPETLDTLNRVAAEATAMDLSTHEGKEVAQDAQDAQRRYSSELEAQVAQRTASQLKDAVVARSVVDQAKGILMHALSCDADEALQRLRQESQRRHVKVTEVAGEVVAAYGREG